ncbi:unnamed protein product [Rotaria socialis]|uniref:Uncharacterized protein n=1 Tax=Rotaria socialis TaxID=392032 RepID=A0A817XQL0_9BILA|nr:unnamed protein product [Rotaria socialis]CAF3309409.1 unnamed protein product [Rotaria socialis]CAF3339246.1 unnamed protein product [Rotaria socialis]CAF3370980.1 unnamed protein product [Rotaria socialis]CAF3498770.1 unnamed protein product [Rotaria socialis]
MKYFMSTYLYTILYFYFLFVSIESRRNLQNYIVSHEYLSEVKQDQFSVYDQSEKNLLCRIESSSSDYLFNRLNNLIAYPSYQSIASMESLWTPSPLMYQAYMNILDDQLNQWVIGKIYQRYHSGALQFRIDYRGKFYIMENKFGSLITEIRDEKKPDYILTHFYRASSNVMYPSSKYKIQVYKNDLPHPIYILALYALDSITFNKRIKLIP